jgi:Predicted hydrolase (HAD superfamily)
LIGLTLGGMSRNRLFAFDLDNTLVPNQEIYDNSKRELSKEVNNVVYSSTYHEESEFTEILDNIDRKLYEERVLTNTFQDACVRAVVSGKQADSEIESEDLGYLIHRADELGMAPMQNYQDLETLKGADSALEYVKSQGDDVIILTKGVEEAQENKIQQTGLNEYNYVIVSEKTKEHIQTFVDEYGAENVWKVGDSMRSDVKPALKAGAGAIHVDADNWKAEYADDPDREERWLRIPDLTYFEESYSAIEDFDQGKKELIKEIR